MIAPRSRGADDDMASRRGEGLRIVAGVSA